MIPSWVKFNGEIAEEIVDVIDQSISEMILPISSNRLIVSVAANDIALERFSTIPQLILYRREPGVELIRLSSLDICRLLLPSITAPPHLETNGIIIPYPAPKNNSAFRLL